MAKTDKKHWIIVLGLIIVGVFLTYLSTKTVGSNDFASVFLFGGKKYFYGQLLIAAGVIYAIILIKKWIYRG